MAKTHLNGSVNLESAEDVFRTVAEISGETVERIPDGETGDQEGWIMIHGPRLAANPALEPVPAPTAAGYDEQADEGLDSFRLKEGLSPEDLKIDLGYSKAALASYETFAALKSEGVIAPATRFQVSLPTRMAIAMRWISPEQQELLSPAFDDALRADIDRIAAAIPHDQLALQWDVAMEIALLEGLAMPIEDQVVYDQLIEHASFVPADIPLGYHLCYGDRPVEGSERGSHFMEPKDMTVLVGVANAIAKGAKREVTWIHMPVPIDRDDDAYFAPLADLKLPPETQLYLGLVHDEDGLQGTQRRVDAAARVAKGFGVGTECGMSRKPRSVIKDLLEIQRDVVVPS